MTQEKEYKSGSLLILFVILILIVIYIRSINADAYYISKNKIISKSINPIQIIPDNIILTKEKIKEIMNLHGYTSSTAYQSGYSDAIKDVLKIMGLKQIIKQNITRGNIFELYNSNNTITFPIKDGIFIINATYYDIRYYNNRSRWIEYRIENLSYILVYTRTQSIKNLK